MTQVPSRVSIHMVVWNSLTHLSSSLEALRQQTFTDWKLLLVDNASVDQTLPWLQEHYPQFHVLRNTRNLGFCHGHNQALRLTDSVYVLVLNPDVVLSADWLARGVAWLDQHEEYGSFAGLLQRFEYSADELKEVIVSDIIDSAGLQGWRSRHFIDRGSGQSSRDQHYPAGPVFGHSGAAVLYRRSALETVRWHDEYFDEDFFAYKDDVDLAWRLQRLGWDSWFDPDAVAYHHRGTKGQAQTSSLALAKNHRRHQQFIRVYSFRNHWWMLMKMERWSTVWRDGLWISWYEFRKIMYFLIFHPSTLRSCPAILRGWPRMRQKRRLLNRQSKRSALAVRQWFLHSSS